MGMVEGVIRDRMAEKKAESVTKRTEQHIDTILACFRTSLVGFGIQMQGVPMDVGGKKPEVSTTLGASSDDPVDLSVLIYRAGAVAKNMKTFKAKSVAETNPVTTIAATNETV
jgi:hypothetical protein